MAYAFFRPSERDKKAGATLVRYKGQLGVWYVGYRDEHGKRAQRKTRAATQAEAERLAAELERKAERIRMGVDAAVKEDMTYEAAVGLYLASLPPEYRSKKMLEGRFKNRILPHLGRLMCRAITPADVRSMLAKSNAASPQTREHLRIAVQGSYTFLIKDLRLVTGENPGADVEKVRIPKRTPRFLLATDVPRLLAAVPEQHRVLFAWNVATGTRKGEALALTWDRLNLDRGTVSVEASHDSDTTKGGRARTIPVPDWLVAVMREHAKTAKSRWVFPDAKGQQQKKWVKLHLVMRTALCEAGLVQGFDHRCVTRGQLKGCGHVERRAESARVPCPKCGRKQLWPTAVPVDVKFKDLRATFATVALEKTGNIKFVQQVLGHGDVRVTDRYAHLLESTARVHSNQVDFGMAAPISSLQAAPSQTHPIEAKTSDASVDETREET